ncbi:hypothetical protein HHI36_019802, partial [Cryptolaemus montrouzieri]
DDTKETRNGFTKENEPVGKLPATETESIEILIVGNNNNNAFHRNIKGSHNENISISLSQGTESVQSCIPSEQQH